MKESVKRLFEYLIAGIILWLVIEEIKKFRLKRKSKHLTTKSIEHDINEVDNDSTLLESEKNYSRTIVY